VRWAEQLNGASLFTRRKLRRILIFDCVTLVVSLGLFDFHAVANSQEKRARWHIGVVLGASSLESEEAQQFREGLRDAGYSEGGDVLIEWRTARGDYAQIPQLVSDLVQRKVDVLFVSNTPAVQAAIRATSTIPIVMATIADPVGAGLVASLAHPGGNATGLTSMATDLTAKRLQLLKNAIPRLTKAAVLWNPDTPYHPKVLDDLRAAAPVLPIELMFIAAKSPTQLAAALSTSSQGGAQALYVIEDTLFLNHRLRLAKLALELRLPTMFGARDYAQGGGLMSYGVNYGEQFRRAAMYIDKILKGAKPADLPIEQPTKFELVVNLKTARALGITIPQSVLLGADEVIQ
jgi:putative ABC transport system substrate-binding protein